MRAQLVIAVFLLVATAAVGCGASKVASTTVSTTAQSTSTPSQATSTSPRTGKPLSSAQLHARADVICARLSTELDRRHVRSPAEIAQLVPHRVALETVALSRLSELTPPSSLAPDYQAMLNARRTLLEDTRQIATVANNKRAMQALLVSSSELARHMAAVAKHAGFKSCGELG